MTAPTQEAGPAPEPHNLPVGLTPLNQLPGRADAILASLAAARAEIGDLTLTPDAAAAHAAGNAETLPRRREQAAPDPIATKLASLATASEANNGTSFEAQGKGRPHSHRRVDERGQELGMDVDFDTLPAAARKHAMQFFADRQPGRHAALGDPERSSQEEVLLERVVGASAAAAIAGRRRLAEEAAEGLHPPVESLESLRSPEPVGTRKAFFLDRGDKVYASEQQTKEHFGLPGATLVGLMRGAGQHSKAPIRAGIFYSPETVDGPTVTIRSLERDNAGHWALARDEAGAELPPAVTVHSYLENEFDFSLGALTGSDEDRATMVLGSETFKGLKTGQPQGEYVSTPMLYAELPQGVEIEVKK